MPTPQKPQQDSKGCYLLTSKEELYWYARFVNGPWDVANKNRSACASLQNDIVVYKNLLKDSVPDSEKDDFFIWFSIEFFDGTFNGNGHAISGLLMYDGCDDADKKRYGGVFCDVWEGKIENVTIDDSYIVDYGPVEHLVITGKEDYWGALPNVAAKSDWRTTVQGNRVAVSGLVPGKTLLVMDVQGRILRRLATESSMIVELPKSGRYLFRCGNEMRSVSVR